MYISFEYPFGDGKAEVSGYYTPAVAGCMYRSDGSPGDAPELAEFEVDTFEVGGEDITDELYSMYVKLPDLEGGVTFKPYFTAMDSNLYEAAGKAYEAHRYDC